MSGQAAVRIEDVFERTRAEGRAALVGYLPVGYPDVETSLRAMRTVVEAGADVVEVGFPYSDPMMDGPTIQQAAVTALEAGTHLPHVFDAVRTVTQSGAAAVVMSYWNPILSYGVHRFAADLAAAGGSGVITPDLIPDEADEWMRAADRHGLATIFLVAPSSTPERLAMTTGNCRGFVYVASTMGVTGARASVGAGARDLVGRARAVTDLPLAVGLGVSTRAQAADVASFADGVIVGSALVAALGQDASSENPGDLVNLTEVVTDLGAGVREGAGAGRR